MKMDVHCSGGLCDDVVVCDVQISSRARVNENANGLFPIRRTSPAGQLVSSIRPQIARSGYWVLGDRDPPALMTVVDIEVVLVVIPEDGVTVRRGCASGLVHVHRFVFFVLQPSTESGLLHRPFGEEYILTVVNNVRTLMAIDILSGWRTGPVVTEISHPVMG